MKRWPELAIAAVVIAVIVMLIVPLPRPLLDGLLAFNIAVAVALLMASLFTRRPVGFTSFPTLLVVTTLFRVGLEVSTTRLILADADAGEVVAAFGSSVVAGSFVVGLVVFAVITIVQLIVVSRGAERVAEVAARFALDAMPGKQMAIDAEVRSGAIDAESARQRRGELERESQLYGAMDGAMRFVKGDAIAAIVIVVINLIGGLIIGIGMRDMSAGDAVRTYLLLSVGAGLVAQIPSLLVAVASGMLVTRVASTGDLALGEDLPAQLDTRVLVAAAVLLVGLALVPGLPLLPFLVLGLVAGVAAFFARQRVVETLDEPGADKVRGPRITLFTKQRPTDLDAIRASVKERTGIVIPPLAIRIADETSLAVDGTPVAWFNDDGLADELVKLVPELITIDRTAALVDAAAAHSPVLVREVVPRIVTMPVLADVLRHLAREGVPLHDITPILEGLALTPPSKDVGVLVEQLRAHLRRQITARWAPRGQVAVYTLDAMIEDAVRGAIDRRDGAQVLALEPAIAQDIVTAVRNKVGTSGVVLASGDVRRHLRSLIEPELPGVAILAAHELAPGTNVTTAGRIDV